MWSKFWDGAVPRQDENTTSNLRINSTMKPEKTILD